MPCLFSEPDISYSLPSLYGCSHYLILFDCSSLYKFCLHAKKLEAKNFTILETSYSQLADILKADDLCYANGTQLLRDYVKQVNDEDMVTKNISYGPRKSDLILSVLLTNLGKTSNSFSRTGSGIISSLLADIRKARAEVRWITDHQTDVFSWYIMLALGLIAHLSIAAAHIDRARGAIIAILLFSTANSVVYWYIINLENPNFSEDVSRHRIFLQDFSNENIGPVSCKSTVEKGSANVNIGTKQAR